MSRIVVPIIVIATDHFLWIVASFSSSIVFSLTMKAKVVGFISNIILMLAQILIAVPATVKIKEMMVKDGILESCSTRKII